MSKSPVNLIIASQQIRRQDTASVIQILLALTASPESILEHRRRLNLRVELPPNDHDVQRYFTALNDLWPLWPYFLANTESLDYVATAVGGNDAEAKAEFIKQCDEAVKSWLSVYGLS